MYICTCQNVCVYISKTSNKILAGSCKILLNEIKSTQKSQERMSNFCYIF